MKKEEDKFYLTGILVSNKRKEKDEKPQNQTNIKSGRRSLIFDLPMEEDSKKNIIDFNTKYMTQEANTIRERLKSRHSRGDSTNRHFPAVTSNAENNILSKETNETENNKVTLKTANNFAKNFKKENTNNDNFNKLNPLHNREPKNKESSVFQEDKSIKVGLDVEFNDCGSTPGLSEILDSENDLDLSESETKKLIKKNLAKQYNFKQDEDIQNQLFQLKQKKKKNMGEDKNALIKDQKINDNNNNINNLNSNKKPLIGSKNNKAWLCNPSNKEKYEESPKRKKHIGELIGFDKDSQKDKLADIKNKLKILKIKTFTNEDLDKEETEEDKEISLSRDNSLMRQVSKVYKMRQKSTESLIALANSKENNLHKMNSDGKFKTNSNYYDNESALESKIGKKAMIMSEFKNSNFFHKFKLFENNKNFKNKMTSRHNSNLRNSSLENSKSNNSKNLGFNNNIVNQNTINNSSYKSNQDIVFLTARELKQKKLDELYVKNINYDKILKNNIDMMKNLFPDKKGKKEFKEIQTLRATHSGFFTKFNKELPNKLSRNSFLALESNNNTESLNNENFNSKKNNANINIQTEYDFNVETENYSANERNGSRKQEKMDKNISASNGEINIRTENKFGAATNNSYRKNKYNLNNNCSIKLENNRTIEVEDEDIEINKRLGIPPSHKFTKNNYRKFAEHENLNNKNNNETVTYSQAISKILKGKNNIFDSQGGINVDFLRNLRSLNNKEMGHLFHKCYDTKNFEKFDKELIEKINKIRK